MTYSDVEWRVEKRLHMPEGVCSNYPCCVRQRNDWRKKCETCRERDNGRRKCMRAKEVKSHDQCSVHDCRKTAVDGFRMCVQCRVRENTSAKKRNARLKTEVMQAYGGQCQCCEERESSFLSIDHIDGYDGSGPRKSTPLYRWLKKNDYPAGFRVLCMNCNASRGFHGYCPHNVGGEQRSAVSIGQTDAQRSRREKKRKVFAAYGGFHCVCCGERAFEFLCIDHVDNNGAEHRREVRGNILSWLIRNGYPSGFQILCINCNFSKGNLGECAHLKAERN